MSEPPTLFLVGKREGGKRLDQFLHERIPGLSRTRIQRAIRERVTLSWTDRARPGAPVHAGGEVRIGYTPIVETLVEVDLPVLARGEGWLAIDKPSGLVVHPVNRIRENSLIRILRRQENCEALRLAHRLDRETTGVLLVADNSETARRLSLAFMNGQVGKQYLALVRGAIEGTEGSIDMPIGPDQESSIYTKQAAGSGRQASTRWVVERRLGNRTLVRLFPRTGRRHQLRVHLAAIGHPVLGDILYCDGEEAYLQMVRGEDPRPAGDGPRRQLLHCARMTFPDPSVAAKGENITVKSSLPADMR